MALKSSGWCTWTGDRTPLQPVVTGDSSTPFCVPNKTAQPQQQGPCGAVGRTQERLSSSPPRGGVGTDRTLPKFRKSGAHPPGQSSLPRLSLPRISLWAVMGRGPGGTPAAGRDGQGPHPQGGRLRPGLRRWEVLQPRGSWATRACAAPGRQTASGGSVAKAARAEGNT